MNKFEKRFGHPKGVHIKATLNDPVVLNGLALTPRRMDELAKNGIPISEQTSSNAGMMFDGYSENNLSFEPPINYRRHADIIAIHNAQIESRKSFNDYIDTSAPDVQSNNE